MNPLRNLDLNLLVALDRLLATESVSASARELGVTQPAMSRSLERLREALGDPILVRSGRGMIPTDRARQLEQPVAEALAAASRVFEREGPFDPRTAKGEVSIALGDESQTGFADGILERLWEQAPGIDVRFRRLSPESAVEGRRGTLDLAVVPDLLRLPRSAGGVDLSDFVVRPLYERRWVTVSSPLHPRRRWTLDAYVAADHLVVGPEASGRGFVDDLLEKKGLRRRVAATVTSFIGGAHIVARTRLVSTLPEEVVKAAGVPLVVSRPPLEIPAIPMVLLWHPRSTTDARHRFIREVVARAIIERTRK